MRQTILKATFAAALAVLAGCASSPDVLIEPEEPFVPTVTFLVEPTPNDLPRRVEVGISDYVAEALADRGWKKSTTTPTLIVQYSVDHERVLDVERSTGPRGASVVTDVRAGVEVGLAVELIDTAGVTVWAATEEVNLPFGTTPDEACAMVLGTLDTILAAIPIVTVSDGSV